VQTPEFPLQVVGDDEMFVSYVTTAHQGVIDLGQPLACPAFSVVVRLSNDFQVDVVEALQRVGTPDENYSVDRVGGVVGAKNVSSADGSAVEILFDARVWAEFGSDNWTRRFWLVVHELIHPLLGRLRNVAGGAPDASRSAPQRMAQGIVDRALDEWRCETIANMFLGQIATVTKADGTQAPLPLAVVNDFGYLATVEEVAGTRIYPGWPDLVDAHLRNEVSQQDAWNQIFAETDNIVNLLARAEAEAKSVEMPGALPGEVANSAAARLYLNQMWDPIADALYDHAVIPPLEEIKAVDAAIREVGEKSIMAMWCRLGISFHEADSSGYRVDMTRPLRDDPSSGA
jgi:hypothetical protein